MQEILQMQLAARAWAKYYKKYFNTFCTSAVLTQNKAQDL